MIKAKVNGENEYSLALKGNQGEINGKSFEIDVRRNGNRAHVIYEGRSLEVIFLGSDNGGKASRIMIEGKIYNIELTDKYDKLLKKLGIESAGQSKSKSVKAPMPGLVLEVDVKPGDEVSEHEPLLILEAMKMENVIKSPTSGKIKSVHTNQGETVEKNELLVEFE